MRIIWCILCLSVILSSCDKKKEKVIKNEFAIISGTIKNSTDNYFLIIGKQINHRIDLNDDGSFLDTISIKVVTTNGFKASNKQIPIYIKNGYRLNLNLDINDFPNSIQYTGIGAKENKYILEQYKYGLTSGNIGDNGIFSLEEDIFLKKLDQYKKGLDSINNIYNDIEPDLLELTKKQNIKSFGLVKNLYDTSKDALKKQKEVLKKMVKGTPSPMFENYENLEGKLENLKDYRGKYVYIEIWGTWIKKYTDNAEIINNFKKKYKNKNIKFVTLCADNKASSGTISYAKQKWNLSINKHKLSGNHLFIGNDREFLKEYLVLNLPRYILIDPKGKIIDAKAPAPYDKEIKALFNTLKL